MMIHRERHGYQQGQELPSKPNNGGVYDEERKDTWLPTRARTTAFMMRQRERHVYQQWQRGRCL